MEVERVSDPLLVAAVVVIDGGGAGGGGSTGLVIKFRVGVIVVGFGEAAGGFLGRLRFVVVVVVVVLPVDFDRFRRLLLLPPGRTTLLTFVVSLTLGKTTC